MGHSFSNLYGAIDYFRLKTCFLFINLQRTGQVKLRIEADDLTVVVRYLENVTWLYLAKSSLGLVQLSDCHQVTQTKLVLAKQFFHRVAGVVV